MKLMGKRVLVTGPAGFIGSHVTELLVHEGCRVRAFVRYNSRNTNGFLDMLEGTSKREIEVVKGDLRDPAAVTRAVQGTDIVFHLGASIAIPYSYHCPGDVVQTNVLGTLHVLEAALAAGVDKVVHTSTSEVYGSARVVPMSEDHPLSGQSPYSASKIGADSLVHSFYCSYALPVITVRPFNAYGPRQSMRAVIPTIINQALHETSIQLGNLDTTRDFTFVEDSARAFLCAAKADEGFGEVFNAGSGFEISIGELAETIRELVGRKIPIVVSATRARPENSEVNRLFSDSTRAASRLLWQPKVSLADGLSRTIAWMRTHQELYKSGDYVI